MELDLWRKGKEVLGVRTQIENDTHKKILPPTTTSPPLGVLVNEISKIDELPDTR